ncbi:stage 0 sporulation protein B (sporulation initiation phosphotransferase) [Pullulanibacillus pueri]|uniref:Sporulation initiation phosphotransferase B n=1 Tax=Pullulanibacillus pueri TaxID=1437324 RepID=A0A8J2ZYY4_9BACL|nr:Spo0B C-terminal domain-containing protein [Pullulanibacillus pueri]MBM7683282.1 stage 0 sporulation protein B (sporulation initiation phosphotransferase) [Pullulanibacillus pueri]GGH85823.1 sporulation initiation phosphotransferase B [Pullulanibacillus pueri]
MGDAQHTVDLLRAIRHDWLNDLQLIKANLDLMRVDRASEIIASVIVKAKNEALLSNVAGPKLAAFLLTYNLDKPAVSLDVEVTGHPFHLVSYDDKLYAFFKETLDYFNRSVEHHVENTITLRIDQEEDRMKMTLDFVGMIKDVEQAKAFFLRQRSNHSLDFDTEYVHSEEVVLTFSIHR